MDHTYPLESLRRSVFLLIAGVIAVMGLGLALVSAWILGAFDRGSTGLELLDLLFIALPLLVLGGIGGAIAWATTRIQLRLSDNGVVLELPGGRVEAAWEDVTSIGPAFLGPLTGEALLLRRPARIKLAWWMSLANLGELTRAIPLGAFALPVRGSRLAAQVRFHAPHVFETPDAQAAESIDRLSA